MPHPGQIIYKEKPAERGGVASQEGDGRFPGEKKRKALGSVEIEKVLREKEPRETGPFCRIPKETAD